MFVHFFAQGLLDEWPLKLKGAEIFQLEINILRSEHPLALYRANIASWEAQNYIIPHSSAARGTEFAQGGWVWQVLPLPPARGSAHSQTFVVSARLCCVPTLGMSAHYKENGNKHRRETKKKTFQHCSCASPLLSMLIPTDLKKVVAIGKMQQTTTNFFWDIKLASIWNYVVWAFHQVWAL